MIWDEKRLGKQFPALPHGNAAIVFGAGELSKELVEKVAEQLPEDRGRRPPIPFHCFSLSLSISGVGSGA